jgi:hypothetical protein
MESGLNTLEHLNPQGPCHSYNGFHENRDQTNTGTVWEGYHSTNYPGPAPTERPHDDCSQTLEKTTDKVPLKMGNGDEETPGRLEPVSTFDDPSSHEISGIESESPTRRFMDIYNSEKKKKKYWSAASEPQYSVDDYPRTDVEKYAYINSILGEIEHNRERHFKCKLCGEKQFLNKYKLITHFNRDHQDADPLTIESMIQEAKDLEQTLFPPKRPVCESCGKIFKMRKHLTLHISKFHKRTLCCDICDKKFFTKPLLYRHLQDDHGIEEPNVDAYDRGRAGRANDPHKVNSMIRGTLNG